MNKKLIVHFSFLGLGVIAVIISIIMTLIYFNQENTYMSTLSSIIGMCGLGLALTLTFKFRAYLLDKYGKNEKKVSRRVLLILGIIGLVMCGVYLLASIFTVLGNDGSDYIATMSYHEYILMGENQLYVIVGAFVFSLYMALAINWVFANLDKFDIEYGKFPVEFFKDYSFYISLAIVFAITAPASNYVPLLVMIAFIINAIIILVYYGLRVDGSNIAAYIVVGVCGLINLFILLGLSSGGWVSTDFTDGANVFCFASLTYIYLSIIICVPLSLIMYLFSEKLSDKFKKNDLYNLIVAIAVPWICFGLQVLMLFYWYIALIAVIAILGCLVLLGAFVGKKTIEKGAYGSGKRVKLDDVERVLYGCDFGYGGSWDIEQDGNDVLITIYGKDNSTINFTRNAIIKKLYASDKFGSNVIFRDLLI